MHTPEQRELAQYVHDSNMKHAAANPHERVTKDRIFDLGRLIWPFSYKKANTDEGAAMALMESANEGVIGRDPYWTLLAAELMLPQNQLVYTASALWCHQGFPQIVMGHKYAAALMATKLSKDVIDTIRPPWRAFFVEVPAGLLFAYDNIAKRESSVVGALVAHVDHKMSGTQRWAYYAITESQVTLWRHGAESADLLVGDKPGCWDEEPFIERNEKLDDRTNAMLGRLILNACLAMTDPKNVKPPKGEKKMRVHNQRESSEPKVRTYVLGATPSVDCRAAITNYLRTGRVGSELNVQVLVAAHWRNVPHGPEHALRRMQWIEPYWKGPDDAPILVKATALKDRA